MNFWANLPKPFNILAPMEDVTDIVFRDIIAEIGKPDVMFTEFTNAEGLNSPGRAAVGKRLRFNESHRPIVAQIWGITPEAHFQAAKDIVEIGFDGVDINMGCPIRKITSGGACSKLIDNPTLAGEIIQATKEGTAGKIPVSVKTRIGFNVVKTEEWAGFLLNQGIAALTVHGRIAKHQSKFPANWEEVGKVVKLRDQMQLETVIIGNGDVMSLEEAQQKSEVYGVDGVMIGRGIFQDPFLFNPNKSIKDLSKQERFDLLVKHATLFEQTWGKGKNFAILKKFFKIYIADFEGAVELRTKLMECDNLAQVLEIGKQL